MLTIIRRKIKAIAYVRVTRGVAVLAFVSLGLLLGLVAFELFYEFNPPADPVREVGQATITELDERGSSECDALNGQHSRARLNVRVCTLYEEHKALEAQVADLRAEVESLRQGN